MPAYLPKRFDRSAVEIHVDGTGPRGEPLAKLIYTDRYKNQLILTEWVPAGQTAETAAASGGSVSSSSNTRWISATNTRVVIQKEYLTIQIDLSSPQTLIPEQFKTVIDTLSIPTGMKIYTSAKQIPMEKFLPPAVEILPGQDGVQEVVLVVSLEGYTPTHFSVKKGVPVRLTFKQLGDVGCGNELFLNWGSGTPNQAHLILASASDTKTVEFTPNQSGIFQFNCSHLYYVGAITVNK